MRKLVIFTLLLMTIPAMAQEGSGKGKSPEQRKERREKIDSLKQVYINTELELTKEQQDKFWPVYDEMHKKMKEAGRKKVEAAKDLKANIETLKEAEIKAKVDIIQAAEQEKLNLKKEYSTKIANVITYKKAVQLVGVEHDFREKLREEMEKRRGGKQQGSRPAPLMEEED
ncbi:MAG: hypothetical protein V4638_02455 [Bacteroidota bacterium]